MYDDSMPVSGDEPSYGPSRQVADLVPEVAWNLVDLLTTLPANAPASACITARLGDQTFEVLPYKYGETDPSCGWSGYTDWAVLLVYPGGIPEEHDTDAPEVYVFPGYAFTTEAREDGGTFLRVDAVSEDDDPGILWVDLTEDAYRDRHARLSDYLIRPRTRQRQRSARPRSTRTTRSTRSPKGHA
jgi:hypothetical protein